MEVSYNDGKELYQQWLEHATEDADLQTELKGIADDDAAISDRFYRDLEFGTGGLRGVIGAGTYRMNIYTVRRATQGLANYVKSAFEAPSVAISYDSRIKSRTHLYRTDADPDAVLCSSCTEVQCRYHGYRQPQPRKVQRL